MAPSFRAITELSCGSFFSRRVIAVPPFTISIKHIFAGRRTCDESTAGALFLHMRRSGTAVAIVDRSGASRNPSTTKTNPANIRTRCSESNSALDAPATRSLLLALLLRVRLQPRFSIEELASEHCNAAAPKPHPVPDAPTATRSRAASAPRPAAHPRAAGRRPHCRRPPRRRPPEIARSPKSAYRPVSEPDPSSPHGVRLVIGSRCPARPTCE